MIVYIDGEVGECRQTGMVEKRRRSDEQTMPVVGLQYRDQSQLILIPVHRKSRKRRTQKQELVGVLVPFCGQAGSRCPWLQMTQTQIS